MRRDRDRADRSRARSRRSRPCARPAPSGPSANRTRARGSSRGRSRPWRRARRSRPRAATSPPPTSSSPDRAVQHPLGGRTEIGGVGRGCRPARRDWPLRRTIAPTGTVRAAAPRAPRHCRPPISRRRPAPSPGSSARWPPSRWRCGRGRAATAAVPRLADAVAVDPPLARASAISGGGTITISTSRVADRCRRRRANSAARSYGPSRDARPQSAAPARLAPPARRTPLQGAARQCGIEIGRRRRVRACVPKALFETVTALPPSPSAIGAMVGTASGVRPRLAAIGIGASMWATWKWPTAMRSRMLAHEVSRTARGRCPRRRRNPSPSRRRGERCRAAA